MPTAARHVGRCQRWRLGRPPGGTARPPGPGHAGEQPLRSESVESMPSDGALMIMTPVTVTVGAAAEIPVSLCLVFSSHGCNLLQARCTGRAHWHFARSKLEKMVSDSANFFIQKRNLLRFRPHLFTGKFFRDLWLFKVEVLDHL